MIEESRFSITNLRLNKLMYYVYGLSIANNLKLSENPQAWKYGPVFPSIYHVFKIYGLNPIEKIAKGYKSLENNEMIQYIESAYNSLKRLKDWELVSVSHAPGGPWHNTYKEEEKYLEIPDGIIKDYFIQNYLDE